jgi:peptidoglycan/xylan/chitin deacetylase (PgdA/CDA1 family)
VLDAVGVKATVALNSQYCETFPKAMDEMKKRGWEFMGHGTTNSESLQGLNPDKEKEVITHVLKTIEQATGKKPRGWLGTGLTETHNTLDILAEAGVLYCGENMLGSPAAKVKSAKMPQADPLLHGMTTTSANTCARATPASSITAR